MSKAKIRRAVLSVLLIAVLLVGATFAYLAVETNEVTNPFSFLGADGIDAELEEPNWDEEEAKNLVPGAEVPKDPLIINSGETDEYVGMKLSFQTGVAGDGNEDKRATLTENQMTLLLSLIDIQYKGTSGNVSGYNPSWLIADSATAGKPVQTWVYTGTGTNYSALAPGRLDAGTPPTDYVKETNKYADLHDKTTMATTAIFDLIVFDKDMSNAAYAWLNGTEAYKVSAEEEDDLGIAANTEIPALVNGFEIFIEGAGVQADVFDGTTGAGKTEIVSAINGLLNPTP